MHRICAKLRGGGVIAGPTGKWVAAGFSAVARRAGKAGYYQQLISGNVRGPFGYNPADISHNA
jgi:hypothetical protein